MQIKAWVLYFLLGGLIIVALSTTNRGIPVDAPLLETLAAPEGSEWAAGPYAALIRMGAGTVEPPLSADSALQRIKKANLVRNLLPAVRDFVILIGTGCLAFAVSLVWKAFARPAPWVALFVFVAWNAHAAWKRADWQMPLQPIAGEMEFASSLLAAHALAVKSAGNGGVWLSPAALRWLPQLGVVADAGQLQESVADAGNPRQWRINGGEAGTSAALLIGSTAEYRPMLDYLLDSPAWHLKSIEPTSLVFIRSPLAGASAESAVFPGAELERRELLFPDPSERASYLARLATMLTEIGRHGEARRLFRRALELDGQRPDVRCLHASFLARRGQWQEAVFEASELLRRNPDFVPGWKVLVQAELAAERPENAWNAAKNLLRLQPRDPHVIFLHARAANAAGASFAETESLRRLIRITSQMGLSTTNYRILLGKSLAKQALLDQARAEFEGALASGDLTPQEEEQVHEFLRKLEESR